MPVKTGKNKPTYAELKAMYEEAEQELKEAEGKENSEIIDLNKRLAEFEEGYVAKTEVFEWLRAECDYAAELHGFGTGGDRMIALAINAADGALAEALSNISAKYQPAKLLDLLQRIIKANPYDRIERLEYELAVAESTITDLRTEIAFNDIL